MKITRQSLPLELLIYLALWILLLLAPLQSEWLQARTDDCTSFEWSRVFGAWLHLLPFFLAFVVHNWLLAPLVVYRHKLMYYIIGLGTVVLLFTVFECISRPPRHLRKEGFPTRIERPMGENPKGMPHMMKHRPHEGHRPNGGPRHRRPDDHQRPPVFLWQHDLVSFIILILMLGMNIGVKFYFRQREGDLRLHELERENLAHQLAYLRHQVNPHFLMNTLNNIHALIDIDTESAQSAIVELSRLLRYSIYDAERERVPLSKEVDFLRNYLALMRIRYDEQVEIRFDVPDPLPACNIPPMIYASFVENAFKHGVSYQQHSFVHISLQVEAGRLLFCCLNSRKVDSHSKPGEEGGMGLRNVRKRLELLFHRDYTLVLQDTGDTYAVRLNIPANC